MKGKRTRRDNREEEIKKERNTISKMDESTKRNKKKEKSGDCYCLFRYRNTNY